MKRTFDHGYSYAASIKATELYHQTGDDDMSEFWTGYNEYIYETQELKKVKKEIQDLRQAILNCKLHTKPATAVHFNKGE